MQLEAPEMPQTGTATPAAIPPSQLLLEAGRQAPGYPEWFGPEAA